MSAEHVTTKRRIRRRGDEVGLFIAAASAPRSFQPSLLKRSTTDQGIATGVIMATTFLLAALIQDGVDAATDKVVNARIETGKLTPQNADDRRIQYSLLASVLSIVIGTGAQKALKRTERESEVRAAARTASFWLANTGIAGLAVGILEALFDGQDRRSGRVRTKQRIDDSSLWPFIVPLGAGISILNDLLGQRTFTRGSVSLRELHPARAISIGTAVAGVLSGVALGERFVARGVDKLLSRYVPEIKALRLPVGHLLGFGLLGGGLYKALHMVMQKAEHSGVEFETGYHDQPTSDLVSGSPASAVPWDTLSRQGRRFVGSITTKQDINHVMHTRQAIDPIRVFVGLMSAESQAERVEMAVQELRRTGAFDRDVLVVIQPTGTGYVNYVFAESVEYLARGNCALVAVQYSLRPSPLSLDRLDVGARQHRMLLTAIQQELAKRPENNRPRVMLFGESLGAWTSQRAFRNLGTDGLKYIGVDRSLWIGTPAGSNWHTQVFRENDRLDTDRTLVGEFNDFTQVQTLNDEARDRLRYVLLTNDNDPIAKFDGVLLVREPDWLVPGEPRPASLPAHTRWRSPATFVQLLIDMKNALKPTPGVFVADGHDYRATLPDFVNFTYGFGVSDDQITDMTVALKRNEVARAAREAL